MNAENTLSKQAPERMQERPAAPPPVDVYENRDEILVIADVPGVPNDAVSIRLEKEQLSLHARRGDRARGDLVSGRALLADWSRTFVVPRGIDAEKISAELKDGVLTIHLPKSEAVKPRQITVRAG
jgi:HSP20 family molecular chaperone IbpA